MKRRHKGLIWGVAIAGPLILVGLPILSFWLWLHPSSLQDWIERVRRPGYRLLYSTETPDRSYYAFFDAGNDRLAFCQLESAMHESSSTSITTVDGEDVVDTKQLTGLTRNLLGVYHVSDGIEIPIKGGVVGKLRVRHTADHRVVLDVEVPWGTTPGNSVNQFGFNQ